MGIKQDIAKFLDPQVYNDKKEYYQRILNQEAQIKNMKQMIDLFSSSSYTLQKNIISMNEAIKLLKDGKTEFELYCQKKFTEVPIFGYKKKFYIKEKEVLVSPNEFITPDAFLIQKYKKELQSKYGHLSRKDFILKEAEFVDNKIKWTDDKKTYGVVDRYAYPNMILSLGLEDCEAHAHVLSSLDNEIGVAYGFCGETGHAFGVCIIDGDLYVIETNNVYDTNNNAKLIRYNTQTTYILHWIHTKNHTYKCLNNPIYFGEDVKID